MNRFLFALAVALVAPAPALAQDMPLSQILIDGEGWKKVEGKSEKPKGVKIQIWLPLLTENANNFDITFPSGKTLLLERYWGVPTAALLTPDGGTLYIGGPARSHLWAYRVDKEGKATAPDHYVPLRPRRGEKFIAVTGLTTDNDGRIYAATDIGVQVFDPTGRLCGVLTPAAPGKPGQIAFEGDTLTMWIGDTKYARKLRTKGVE